MTRVGLVSRVARGHGLLLAAMLAALPSSAGAQVFVGARDAHFTVGPLFIRAAITPALSPVTVDVLFGLVVQPGQSVTDHEQDVFLLWPDAVRSPAAAAAPDPQLVRFIEARGYTVLHGGVLPLFAHHLYRNPGDPAEERLGGAPFVTFVRDAGPLGLSPPATWIRVPWTPRLVNRVWLVDLRFLTDGLVRPKRRSWLAEAFWGERHEVSLAFHDVHARGVFPLYAEHRHRVLRLADDPAQLTLTLADTDHLTVDEVAPPTASRRLSETLDSTEEISLFLDRGEGVRPQVLRVQFGYFSGVRAWLPVLIPFVAFVLGNAAAVLVRGLAERTSRVVSARLRFGRPETQTPRERGVILSRDLLERLVPGHTTLEEVRRLCGPDAEEDEHLGAPERRTLVYRGDRVVPHYRRRWAWMATVSHWDVEHHEVEIALDHGRVHDVHVRVRRSRLTAPDGL